MHIDFIQFRAWIVAFIPGSGALISFIRQLLGLGKEGLSELSLLLLLCDLLHFPSVETIIVFSMKREYS
jgi:hypothetical protein